MMAGILFVNKLSICFEGRVIISKAQVRCIFTTTSLLPRPRLAANRAVTTGMALVLNRSPPTPYNAHIPRVTSKTGQPNFYLRNFRPALTLDRPILTPPCTAKFIWETTQSRSWFKKATIRALWNKSSRPKSSDLLTDIRPEKNRSFCTTECDRDTDHSIRQRDSGENRRRALSEK